MMIEFTKKYKKSIIAIIIMAFIPYILYGTLCKNFERDAKMKKLELEIEKYKPNSFGGMEIVTACYPLLNDVVFIGDSYTYFMVYDLGYDLTAFTFPGLTLHQLKPLFDASLNSKKKYAVIFIGPNDFLSKTSSSDFKKLLSGYISKLKDELGAKVILCTYLPSACTEKAEKKDKSYVPIKEYNDKLIELIDEKNGIYYLDLSSLNNFVKYRRDEDDDIHFNYAFHVAYINKLYDVLIKIKKDEISG